MPTLAEIATSLTVVSGCIAANDVVDHTACKQRIDTAIETLRLLEPRLTDLLNAGRELSTAAATTADSVKAAETLLGPATTCDSAEMQYRAAAGGQE